jgi:hypothetical protein
MAPAPPPSGMSPGFLAITIFGLIVLLILVIIAVRRRR